MTENPIFIGGAHKSGTTVLRSLLSDHPRLFAIPFETVLPELLGWQVDIPYRRQRASRRSPEQVREHILRWVRFSNEQDLDRLSDNLLLGRMDMARFERALRIEDTSLRHVGEAVFRACHAGLMGQELPGSIRVVEKSVVNHAFAREFIEAWPNAKLVHVVRNPYAHFVSFRRYKQRSGAYPLLSKLIGTLQVHFEMLERNLESIPGYEMVRYEDLVLRREATMRSLIQELDLAWDDALLVPTKTGVAWKGNSSRVADAEAGVDLNAWQQDITDREVALVEKHLGPWVDRMGYDRSPVKGTRAAALDQCSGLVRTLRNRLWEMSH